MPYKDKKRKIEYQREYMRRIRGTNTSDKNPSEDLLDPVRPLQEKRCLDICNHGMVRGLCKYGC